MAKRSNISVAVDNFVKKVDTSNIPAKDIVTLAAEMAHLTNYLHHTGLAHFYSLGLPYKGRKSGISKEKDKLDEICEDIIKDLRRVSENKYYKKAYIEFQKLHPEIEWNLAQFKYRLDLFNIPHLNLKGIVLNVINKYNVELGCWNKVSSTVIQGYKQYCEDNDIELVNLKFIKKAYTEISEKKLGKNSCVKESHNIEQVELKAFDVKLNGINDVEKLEQMKETNEEFIKLHNQPTEQSKLVYEKALHTSIGTLLIKFRENGCDMGMDLTTKQVLQLLGTLIYLFNNIDKDINNVGKQLQIIESYYNIIKEDRDYTKCLGEDITNDTIDNFLDYKYKCVEHFMKIKKQQKEVLETIIKFISTINKNELSECYRKLNSILEQNPIKEFTDFEETTESQQNIHIDKHSEQVEEEQKPKKLHTYEISLSITGDNGLYKVFNCFVTASNEKEAGKEAVNRINYKYIRDRNKETEGAIEIINIKQI